MNAGISAVRVLSGLGVVAGLLAARPAEAIGFLCTETERTGFSLDGVTWSASDFTPSGKYILEPLTTEEKAGKLGEGGKLNWGYRDDGDPASWVPCLAKDDLSQIECDGIIHLRMNGKTGRFVYAYIQGYVNGNEDTDTPLIAIGTCTSR